MRPTPEQRLVALMMGVFVAGAVLLVLFVVAKLLLPDLHAITGAL